MEKMEGYKYLGIGAGGFLIGFMTDEIAKGSGLDKPTRLGIDIGVVVLADMMVLGYTDIDDFRAFAIGSAVSIIVNSIKMGFLEPPQK